MAKQADKHLAAATKAADVIVIGCGIAGASLAANLSATHGVIVLDMETAAGYHATGRSAAAYVGSYGNATIRDLSRRSWPFFQNPPGGFTETPLLTARDVLIVASAQTQASLMKLKRASPHMRDIGLADAFKSVPILDPEYVSAAAIDTDTGDLDVAALLQGYLRLAKANGAQLIFDQKLENATRDGGSWRVTTATQSFTAPLLVNAAGAWADQVGGLFGARPLGLRPLRRTACLVAVSEAISIRHWPIVFEASESFYMKPDAGKLLISPADETPSEPCDAQPERYDVAVAVDRFETICTHEIGNVTHQWAGLRTFAPDRTPVMGFDDQIEGLFWFAGQGGYGVQTAPAMAQLGGLALRQANIPDAAQARLIQDMSPLRLRNSAGPPGLQPDS